MKRLLVGLAMMGLSGCATDSGKDAAKLQFENTGKSSLTVGETSPLWVMSKTSADANGKTITTKPYTHFTLVSSDTNVASVVHSQQLLAKSPGTTEITATDDKDATLTTLTAAEITVLPSP